MAGQTPPFAGLRVLEAACRLKSYTAAGEALGVTHSAVSQAVRRLELAYGQKLFHRQGSQMAPTVAALAFAEAYRDAARIVERVANDVSRQTGSSALVLSTLPSVARLWLSLRLRRLHDALPDITVEVRTTRELANLETDGVDVAIRSGVGTWPRLRVEPLFEHVVFPVCSPELVKRHGPFTDESIASMPLILEDDDMWSPWFAAAGVAPRAPKRGLTFDDATMVIEAAAAGLGVALVRRMHAEAALETGRLVRISQVEAKTGGWCYLLWRDDSPRIAAIRRFTDWLLGECHRAGLLEAA